MYIYCIKGQYHEKNREIVSAMSCNTFNGPPSCFVLFTQNTTVILYVRMRACMRSALLGTVDYYAKLTIYSTLKISRRKSTKCTNCTMYMPYDLTEWYEVIVDRIKKIPAVSSFLRTGFTSRGTTEMQSFHTVK